MSIANKLNSGRSTVAEGIDLDDLKFVKASEITGDYTKKPIILKGFLRYNTKKGPAVLVVTNDGRGIYLPQRYCEDFDALSEEEIADIIAGNNAISKIEDWETPNGDTVKITFIDL